MDIIVIHGILGLKWNQIVNSGREVGVSEEST